MLFIVSSGTLISCLFRSVKSRSRSRERGHHPAMSSSKADGEKHLTFKEKMRQQLLKASKYLQGGEGLEVDGEWAFPF